MENEERITTQTRIRADPIAYTLYNPAQMRAIAALEDPDVVVVVIAMGNGTGKTFGLGGILGAIMFGTANPLFQAPLYHNWPFPKSLRIVSTSKLVEDNSAIQKSMKAQWPAGHWKQHRGSGKGYYSEGTTDTGWDWDVMTYNQAVDQQAGDTKGLIACSEPPPPGLMGELAARLRAGGKMIIEMTPLTAAAHIKDMVDEGVLKAEDGTSVGKVVLVTGDIHENCMDHFEGGQLRHIDIERTVALWPIEEREFRKTGAFMHLAGLIYQNWSELNEIKVMPSYHEEMWDAGKFNLVQVLDPHDRKPFAASWEAIFPNDDVITVAEWPDAKYPAFHQIQNSPVWDIDEYRSIFLATESAMGVTPDWRLIDPRFGNAPKAGAMGKTVKQLFVDPCRKCVAAKKTCVHRIIYQDAPSFEGSIEEGHLLVRQAIGNPREHVRPKLFAMDYCRNTIFGHRRYGYKLQKDPTKGLSEVPELVHKDFPDLKRYLYLAGAKYRAPSGISTRLTFKRRGKGIHAT